LRNKNRAKDEYKSTSWNLWTLGVCAWLIYMVLFGGVSLPNSVNLLLQSCTSAGVIVASAWRLRHGFPTKLAVIGALLACLCFVLLFAQLIPLPPSYWSAMPGREFLVKAYGILGEKLPWQPMTLSQLGTWGAALALLPAMAAFLAALSSRSNERIYFFLAILLCAIVSLLIAMLQKVQGTASILYFYGVEEYSTASGTFGNRNFFAAQLFVSIPLMAALAMAAIERWQVPQWVILVFTFVYGSLFLAGLAATGSRGGIALAMLSVVLTAVFVYRRPKSSNGGVAKKGVFIALIAALAVISQTGLIAILRLAKTDALTDIRGTIFEASLTVLKANLPFGSGFGTFVPVYQMFETPQIMVDSYINHAHNDWLELVLEGGLPAAALIVVFMVLFFTCIFSLFRAEFASVDNAVMRAGAVMVLLFLIHATVDFGLRTPALLTLFGLGCGLICLVRHNEKTWKPARGTGVAPALARQPIRPFTKPGNNFGAKARHPEN
jgi:O-Antigen ligase